MADQENLKNPKSAYRFISREFLASFRELDLNNIPYLADGIRVSVSPVIISGDSINLAPKNEDVIKIVVGN